MTVEDPQDLLNCHTQVKQLIKPTAIESNKRRFTVHRCVEKLLAQQPVEHLFHDAVDALDQKVECHVHAYCNIHISAIVCHV